MAVTEHIFSHSIEWRDEDQRRHNENDQYAYASDEVLSWWEHGIRQRLEGPALIDILYNELRWYINDERANDFAHFQKLAGHSDEKMAEIIMKYPSFDVYM